MVITNENRNEKQYFQPLVSQGKLKIWYRDPLIVFLMREPSIFCGIAVSLFWLVIGSQIEIDVTALNWVPLTYAPNFKTFLQ